MFLGWSCSYVLPRSFPQPISLSSAYIDKPGLVSLFLGMTSYNITEAKAQLSRLLELVARGEQLIITKAGKPIAVLAPYKGEGLERAPGRYKGQIRISKDFDSLPDDIREAFGDLPT